MSDTNSKGSVFHIQFHESQSSFQPAERLRDEDWIDTSFSTSPRAVGNLRMPAASNGRYGAEHPVFDADGNQVGYMVNGVSSLGYTFTCVYAGDCFWIAHQGFEEVTGGIDYSEVSLVDAILSNERMKFEVVKSFGFGGYWVDNIRMFKLLDDGRYLIYLTTYGVCLFDTVNREIVAKTDFTDIAHQWTGFALSPKVKLLAVGCSMRGDQTPIDGEHRYENSVRIYNLETGVVVGEQILPGDQRTRWTVDFSENGRRIGVSSDSSKYVFDLSAKS